MKCVAGVIMNEKGEVLLQNHVKNNAWTLPGGKVDEGENEGKSLVRELFEELGILAYEYGKIQRDFEEGLEYPFGSGNLVDFDIHIYRVYDYKGEIENKEPEKHIELKFMSTKEIRELDRRSCVLDSYLKVVY